jgi:hypothetical protein
MPFFSDLRAMIFAGIAALCLVIAVVQTVRIEGFGIWPLKIPGLQDKYDTAVAKLVEARAELKRISTAKNEQKIITVEKIREVEKIRRVAEKEAERIETAPLLGSCKTPKEILESYEL